MAPFKNPPIIDESAGAPANNMVLQYSAATDTWIPVTLGSLPAAVIPQSHIAAEADPAAVGTSALATTAATQTTPWGFATEAQAEAIATKFNLAVTDITNLNTSLEDTIDTLNTLIAELQTAGILS